TSALNGSSASASASANLGSGTLRSYCFANGLPSGAGSQCGTWAELGDRVTFSIPGANSNTVTNIDIYYSINGTLSPAHSASTDVKATFAFGNGNTNFEGSWEPAGDQLGLHVVTQTQGGWVSFDWGNPTGQTFTFHGVYALQGANPAIDFWAL